uniref:Uncharacterized protein PB18E9.04c-like n=1 Tax=Cicer arietinum TaxID=3827 RepID=A0A1S3EBK8_CICAR|nr:uncharacterized protein PB18E9.04c-like [Cicer arietinum]
MARTKQSARKNVSPCTPPSSSSSYQSRERSPSPPPRPSPPHPSSASPSSHNSQEVLNLIPLSTFLPPLYTRPTPNFAQVPPHLRTRITHPRRSMRVQSGIGTSKSINPKPFYFIISDSESDDSSDSCPPVAKSLIQTEPQRNTMPTVPTPPPQIPSTTTKPSTPSKSTFSSEPSHSTPLHQKRRSLNDIVSPSTNQKEPISQPKPPTKPMRTKNTITIAQFLARKNLPNPQRKKTLAPKQNLKTNGNAVLHHTDVLGWTSFLKISESYFPDVLPTEGPSVFGDNWYLVLGLRKTNVLAELFEENSTRFLATYLKPLPKEISDKTPTLERSPPPPERSPELIPSPSTLFAQTSGNVPSHIPSYSQPLHCPTHDFSTILSNPLLSTMSPLFVSPQKTSSSIFGISQFLNFPATAGPSTSSVGPLPSVSSSFASFPSLSTMPIPSNTVVATSFQPSAHLPSTSTLVAPSNSDIMAALQIIMARQILHDQETALLRTWMADHLAPKQGIPPPPPHPVPPPSQIPPAGKSSSSEGSSPSLAS